MLKNSLKEILVRVDIQPQGHILEKKNCINTLIMFSVIKMHIVFEGH